MRYAIFSDIHGNLQAWNAIRRDMVDLQADVLVCLGDVVGYGPLPEEVLSAIREVTPNFVLGNHDAAAVGLLDPSLFNEHAESVIKWTSDQLSEDSKEFLLKTPLEIEDDDILFVHAEINQPGLFGYIETAEDAREQLAHAKHSLTFIGHTHHPLVFDLDAGGEIHPLPDSDLQLDSSHRYIVNVGSVGEPRNPDDIRARYVIYDSDTRHVYFRRVAFDPEAYRRDLQATSLDLNPYFLQVVDHQAALESGAQRALMIDMQRPAVLPNYAAYGRPAQLTRRLHTGTPIHTRPKPIPNIRRSSPWPMITIALLAVLVLALSYLVFFSPEGDDPVPQLTVSPKSPDKKPDRRAELDDTREPEPADPEIETPPEDPEPEEVAVVTESPDPREDTHPDPGIGPAPAADEETTPEEITKTIAYWRMDEDSPGESLADASGAIALKSLTAARSIDPIAPNPIPLTDEENAHSLTLASWIENGHSNTFALTAASSFTFEGWILADRPQKPIFVAGTKKGLSPGWRLDLSAARSSTSLGSIRLQFKGIGEPIAIQSNEIEFGDPVAHHFAVVWDHDLTGDVGSAQIFFDGTMVAEGKIPHSEISAIQPPFRLGDSSNPDRVAIDEIRFTTGALAPQEHLNLGRDPKAALPPAFMIDVGKQLSTYDGAESPAHVDGAIPGDHTTWIYANADSDRNAPSRIVKLASGIEYPIPLTIDLGIADHAKPEKGVVWKNHGGETIRTGGRKTSVFGSELMDSSQDPDGELPIGIRVRGLEAGTYTVYFTPLVADELDEEIRFGIGVDEAKKSGEVRRRNDPGMHEIKYEGGKAEDSDRKWELERNFFKQEVKVKDPQDYIVVIVWRGKASTAIPFLQIVKESPSQLADAGPPIEFNFDDGAVVNQAQQLHPAITAVTPLKPLGFVEGSLKIGPHSGSDTTVHATLTPPAPGVKDYFQFEFEVSAAEVKIAGFSLQHAGHASISSNVTLHRATGAQIGELVPNFSPAEQLAWTGVGSLAAKEPLGIKLKTGTYQIRLNAVAKRPGRVWTIDSVKMDFER